MDSTYHKFFDIYGNERPEAWKLLLQQFDGKPEDSGLTYPDVSWWADPNLLTGTDYDLLMMWLTEPTIHTTNTSNREPIPRIRALRGISVSHSVSLLIPELSTENKKKIERFYKIIDEYESQILGNMYLSIEEIESNVEDVTKVGKFFNQKKEKGLSPFRYRIPMKKHVFDRKLLWVYPRGDQDGPEWVEIPSLLYQCLTIDDRTLTVPEMHKKNVGVIMSRYYSGHLPPLEEEIDNLEQSYQDIIAERNNT